MREQKFLKSHEFFLFFIAFAIVSFLTAQFVKIFFPNDEVKDAKIQLLGYFLLETSKF